MLLIKSCGLLAYIKILYINSLVFKEFFNVKKLEYFILQGLFVLKNKNSYNKYLLQISTAKL